MEPYHFFGDISAYFWLLNIVLNISHYYTLIQILDCNKNKFVYIYSCYVTTQYSGYNYIEKECLNNARKSNAIKCSIEYYCNRLLRYTDTLHKFH